MNIGKFVDSINEAMKRDGDYRAISGGASGVLGFELKIEDRLTGEFLPVDEVAIDAERRELRIVINTEAGEQAVLLDKGDDPLQAVVNHAVSVADSERS